MYKVFVNNKPLTIGAKTTDAERNLPFINSSVFHQAIDLLNHNCNSVNIYSLDTESTWEKFKNEFTQIQAAGGVVFNQNKDLLWIYRLGNWDLPKGKMEAGESIEETAKREVEEECGISNLEITKRLSDTYHMYFHKEYILKVTYWFEMKYDGNESLKPQTEEGISDIKWIAEKDWEEPLKNTYANILSLLEPYI